jgi:hypothetical protein
MVFRVAAVVALVVLAILAIAAFRIGTIQILCSRSIQAPPDKVFALINDFHNWVGGRATARPGTQAGINKSRTLSNPEASLWKSTMRLNRRVVGAGELHGAN